MARLAHQKNVVYKYFIQAHFSFWFLLQNKRSSYAKTNTGAAYIKCAKKAKELKVGERKGLNMLGKWGKKKEDTQVCCLAQRKEDYAGNTHLQKEGWSDGWHSKQNVEE